MSNHKLGRNTEDLKREIMAIMREMKDPRISGKMLSVVRVDVSRDMSYCKVYVSAMEGMESALESVKALNAAAGYVRKEAASRLTLRHIPSIKFEATDSIEYSSNIAHILNQLNIKNEDSDADDNEKS